MDDERQHLEQAHHAHHVTDEQLGGTARKVHARRSDRLVVLELVDSREQADVVLTSKVPRMRDECPSKRPCGAWRCEWNLSRVDAADRPGRRGPKHHYKPTLEFVDGQSNCALDVIEQGPTTFRELAPIFGCTPRRLQQQARRALLKLKAAGVPCDDLIALVESEELDEDETRLTDTRRTLGAI